MAVMKHTAGPLVATPEQTWWNVKVVDSDRPETDAATASSTLTAGYCTEGDARLYAAAPDLLRAAQRALNVLKATGGNTVQPGNVLDALDKAIRRATSGEA
jgi:hypothetical protein